MKAALDKTLGMDRRITRRDFLNGSALAIGASLIGPRWLHALESEPYPPALTGLRGSHEGSWEAAHALRDGSFWGTAGRARDTGESYDLVVVGAGISGLAAAHYYRKAAGEKARILVLDNHDDFGGHARRNEFTTGGRLLLGYGGTFSIDSPAPYSAVAKALIDELGIDVSRFEKVVDWSVYRSRGLRPAMFFDKESFGADRLVKEPSGRGRRGDETTDYFPEELKRFLSEAPLSEVVRRDLLRLHLEPRDYLPGLTADQKKARLARMSYAAFLVDVASCSPGVVPFFQSRPHGLYGVGIDAVPAQDAWGLGLPGFDGLGLGSDPGPGMGRDAIRSEEAERYFFHFPDGNATVARLLVRRLVPAAIPGGSADDVVLARARYAALDEAGAPGRIRLGSTAVKVAHPGGVASAREVEVTYVRGGRLETVRAAHCVLACWNSMIPHLCAELPEDQRQALAQAAKVPLLYTNVAVRDWKPWVTLGVSRISAPGGYHTSVGLDMPVSVGGYACPRSPEEPIVLHLSKTPCSPGLPAREQHRVGRIELLSTPFERYEREIRAQLARLLGPGGFDPACDIEAITVNRWPHGYAYQYNSLFDPFWLEGGEQPCVRARRPFGRIAIANADADAYSYTDAAIDQAYRAVGELIGRA
ncbi:MAG TPA: FAD/NAD(P)-binding protein [Vicinamibacteria bacterium]|nr:FAD/NAD(P)-binding protein [Vicinamibacteria bacterium]